MPSGKMISTVSGLASSSRHASAGGSVLSIGGHPSPRPVRGTAWKEIVAAATGRHGVRRRWRLASAHRRRMTGVLQTMTKDWHPGGALPATSVDDRPQRTSSPVESRSGVCARLFRRTYGRSANGHRESVVIVFECPFILSRRRRTTAPCEELGCENQASTRSSSPP